MNITFEVTIKDLSDGTEPTMVLDDLDHLVFDMLEALNESERGGPLTTTASYDVDIARVSE